ncbi:MAG: PorP/SprF family type IX secretion system membrane protein [Bacteroidales bacterium]|nr:PorP/SprF family type IX secretion system membrane protein [Bacteroidales bacterium]
MITFQQLVMGQDPFFSQFYNSILVLNPAYSGSAHHPRVSAAYRNQIPAMGSPYVTYNAAFDMPVRTLQGGIGINIMNDAQGSTINRTSIDAIYTYFLEVSPEFVVNAGFQASYSHRFLKTGSMILPDGLDATGIYIGHTEPISDMNTGYPDFAVGFVVYNRIAYGGVSMHHLTKPNTSISKNYYQPLPRKLTVHGGVFLSIYERRMGREALKLNPNLVYLHQAGFRQLNYGLSLIYNYLQAGLWFRHSSGFSLNAFSVHFGYEHDYFRIGYSYDFNVMDPWRTMRNMGAHEVTFLLKLEYKKRQHANFKAINCPKS